MKERFHVRALGPSRASAEHRNAVRFGGTPTLSQSGAICVLRRVGPGCGRFELLFVPRPKWLRLRDAEQKTRGSRSESRTDSTSLERSTTRVLRYKSTTTNVASA